MKLGSQNILAISIFKISVVNGMMLLLIKALGVGKEKILCVLRIILLFVLQKMQKKLFMIKVPELNLKEKISVLKRMVLVNF